MIKLIIGGARSGKSSYAELGFKNRTDVVYIATARAVDTEMEDRINHHRSSRPKSWRTFEGSDDIAAAVGLENSYLLDCITILTSNIMFDITSEMDHIDDGTMKKVEDRVLHELNALMDKIEESGYDLTLVTNEVGLSIVPEHHISRVFRDIQGRVNQRAAERADEVYLVCAGIPVKIK